MATTPKPIRKKNKMMESSERKSSRASLGLTRGKANLKAAKKGRKERERAYNA